MVEPQRGPSPEVQEHTPASPFSELLRVVEAMQAEIDAGIAPFSEARGLTAHDIPALRILKREPIGGHERFTPAQPAVYGVGRNEIRAHASHIFDLDSGQYGGIAVVAVADDMTDLEAFGLKRPAREAGSTGLRGDIGSVSDRGLTRFRYTGTDLTPGADSLSTRIFTDALEASILSARVAAANLRTSFERGTASFQATLGAIEAS